MLVTLLPKLRKVCILGLLWETETFHAYGIGALFDLTWLWVKPGRRILSSDQLRIMLRMNVTTTQFEISTSAAS